MERFARWQGGYRGAGDVLCPTGASMRVEHALTVELDGDGLWLSHRAVDVHGRLLHRETGVIRAVEAGVEGSFTMNSGRLEHATGSFSGGVLEIEGRAFLADRRGVRATRRRWAFGEGTCDWALWLSTPAWPELTPHLAASLDRSATQFDP